MSIACATWSGPRAEQRVGVAVAVDALRVVDAGRHGVDELPPRHLARRRVLVGNIEEPEADGGGAHPRTLPNCAAYALMSRPSKGMRGRLWAHYGALRFAEGTFATHSAWSSTAATCRRSSANSLGRNFPWPARVISGGTDARSEFDASDIEFAASGRHLAFGIQAIDAMITVV